MTLEPNTLSPDVAEVTQRFLHGLQEILGNDLAGLYLYGALTFPDSRDTIGDVDYHVIVRHRLDDRLRVEMQALQERCKDLARSVELDLDGYTIFLEDARHTAPPPHQLWPLVRHAPSDASWALHCAHIRAGYVIVLDGPDPREIYPEPAWADLRAALCDEIRFVERVAGKARAYSVLNACRILYSVTTHDVVVSKRAAGMWARERVGAGWRPMIEVSLAAYEKNGPEDEEVTRAGDMRRFLDLLWQEVAVNL